MPETPASPRRKPLLVSASNDARTWRLLADRDLERLAAGERDRILGVLRYADVRNPAAPAPWPICDVPLSPLTRDPACVVLLGRAPTEALHIGDLTCRNDGESLFGVLADPTATAPDIGAATYHAYQTLLRASAELGFPHLSRVWHYLPDINAAPNGLEVYQAFSIGRREALDAWGRIPDAALPAACAIGTRHPGLRVAFLTTRSPGSTLSNIRQDEAYRYPPEYGPRSPAFSRARMITDAAGPCLHVSGTASIRGHRSLHAGRLEQQVQETLRNLDALLQPLGLSLQDAGSGALLTVYLRHETDLAAASALLSGAVRPDVQRLFLQGEICRRSLLVEIEGIIDLLA
ncbi:chorismate transformation enzyme, FkbO/Hyg5 family [Methylolobus aquaticus]